MTEDEQRREQAGEAAETPEAPQPSELMSDPQTVASAMELPETPEPLAADSLPRYVSCSCSSSVGRRW